MLLWVCFAVLTAAVIAVLARPLLREADAAATATDEEAELEVYKDQLREIDAERERGLVGEAEAEAARVEIARRLIKENESREQTPGFTGARIAARAVAGVLGVGLPLAAIAVYVGMGSPTLPSRPFAERAKVGAEHASVADLVGKVEARLRTNPEEGEGWDVIAPVYMRLQRFGDAADAYARATRLLGESPRRLAGLAEALIMSNDGLVGEQARRTYERLLALEPDRLEAKFWLAIAKEQDGNVVGAIADLKGLLDSAPAEAPWKGFVAERLAALQGHGAPGSQAATGPDSGAVDPSVVEGMSPEQRQAFVGQMVDGLAERLKKDGNDLEGWLKLVRSLHVLGRGEEAKAALATARRQFATDPGSLGALQSLADTLGIKS